MEPLLKKLNYKEQPALLVNLPEELALLNDQFKDQIRVNDRLSLQYPIAFAMVFVVHREEVEQLLSPILPLLGTDAVLWCCYPKKTARQYQGDIHRDQGWEFLGKNGFEAVRQVAIDQTWSALRFRQTAFIPVMKRTAKNRISEQGKQRLEEQ